MAGKKLHIIEPTAEEVRKVADAQDLDSLWIDTGLSDGITVTGSHAVTIDKPKTFYRTHPDINYRRRTWVYTHKVEGVIGEQHYIVAKPMRGLIENARALHISLRRLSQWGTAVVADQ